MDLSIDITMAIAVLGAVLGIINTWTTVNSTRVKMRVRPLRVFTERGSMIAIEVTNLSNFALTINDVGFLFSRPWKSTPERLCLKSPIFFDNGQWPRKLEPREQVTAYIFLHDLPNGRSLWAGYARTMCDEIAYGKTPALKEISRQLSNASPS